MGGSLCVGLCCTLLVTKLVVKTLREKLLLMKATLPSNWQKTCNVPYLCAFGTGK